MKEDFEEKSHRRGMSNKMIEKPSLHGFVGLTVWTAVTIALARLFETVFVTYYFGDFFSHFANNLLGMCFDFVYLTLASAVVAVPFCLFSKLSEKKTLLVFRWLYATVALVAMLLVGYYSQTGIPLDRVFFMYSIEEIIEIISSSQTTAWWMWICIAIVPVFLFFISKNKLKIRKMTSVCLMSAFAVCCILRAVFYDSSVNNLNYYEQSDKICYFLKSLGMSREDDYNFDDGVSAEELEKFRSYFPENEFVSADYPFLHRENGGDVLGRFFDLGDEKPNIVMIVVEGLGRENSGRYSKYISTTPFLDSLADHSLYWLNCMSVSQRTAGVLPALFGALPFGREGFMAFKRNAPEFNSLPKILKDNGYKFSFYYGGKADFDNMSDFIELNGGSQYFAERYASSDQRNEWGLYDKFLFAEAAKCIDFQSETPRFDLYMTLTSHTPWDYPDRDKYMDEYSKMTSDEGKTHYHDATSTASYLYVDEALEQIFNAYRNKPGFENTIFIITGDHNYYLYNFVLEKYHVPLLIWSPMLKESRCFPAVASHRDVTPSLLSLLSHRYDMVVPDEAAWLNSGLDTASVFQSTTFSPQMNASRNMVNMIYRDYYVDNGNVYKIKYVDNQLKLVEVFDSGNRMMSLFKLYKAMDKYVCDNDLLIWSDSHDAFEWSRLEDQSVMMTDTIVTNADFPLKVVDLPWEADYNALKIHFSLDFLFEEEYAKQGVSMALVTKIVDIAGKTVYYANNEIRSFDESVKHYEYTETMKRGNYRYSDGSRLMIYLWNWNNLKMGITNVQGSVDVSTGFAYPKSKIWAHRVNSPELANVKKKLFDGIEVDLAYDTDSGELFVSHDIEKDKMRLTFRQYMQMIDNPGDVYYWLDVKNLYDNADAICDTILSLAELYGFGNRFFVESWDGGALKKARAKGIMTSLWVDNIAEKSNPDTALWLNKYSRIISDVNPDALSAEYRMWHLLAGHFPEKNIHLWHTPADFTEENVSLTREMCHDRRVKVVLVDYDKSISY